VEEHFVELVREYWPYCDGSPAFDRANTAAALPDLACPILERETFARLIRFAAADRWGRGRRRASAEFDCACYVEEFFPQAVRRSTLAAVPLDIVVGLEVSGAGGGRWTARWVIRYAICHPTAGCAAPNATRGFAARASIPFNDRSSPLLTPGRPPRCPARLLSRFAGSSGSAPSKANRPRSLPALWASPRAPFVPCAAASASKARRRPRPATIRRPRRPTPAPLTVSRPSARRAVTTLAGAPG
jgi:hypothetical protein